MHRIVVFALGGLLGLCGRLCGPCGRLCGPCGARYPPKLRPYPLLSDGPDGPAGWVVVGGRRKRRGRAAPAEPGGGGPGGDEPALSEHLSEPHLSDVRAGRKTIEGRPVRKAGRDADTRFAGLRPGDLVEWRGETAPPVRTRVVAVRRHASFAAMLAEEGLARVLPGAADLPAGVAVYRRWYPPADEAHGVVAIELERL